MSQAVRKGEPFRQAVPSLSLSLERATPSVPGDGRFHVVLEGTVIYSAESKKDALREYQAIRDRLLPPSKKRTIDVKRALEREAAERQTLGFLAESARAKRAKALRKGGKGGSGGVAG